MAKVARKKKPRAGEVSDARTLLWRALQKAGALLESEDLGPDLTLKLLHGISQGAASYAKVCEVSDLEARIAAIEVAQGINPDTAGPHLARVGA